MPARNTISTVSLVLYYIHIIYALCNITSIDENKASGANANANATNYIPQEAALTIQTIYCATLWKYDKRELLYIEERLEFNLIELCLNIQFDQ